MEFIAPRKLGRCEVVIKRSRFIGQAAPCFSEEKALDFISQVRQEHSGATHNVYAYSVGIGTFAERASDDGEPKGTAGYPVLEVIKKRDLRNVVVTVTRYFGGTKLGAGGLIRAYSNTVSSALDNAGLALYRYHDLVTIVVDYEKFESVHRALEGLGCPIRNISYTEEVTIAAFAAPEDIHNLKARIQELTSDKARVEVSEGTYLIVENMQ
jgi:uncharacterized YigZ family protein